MAVKDTVKILSLCSCIALALNSITINNNEIYINGQKIKVQCEGKHKSLIVKQRKGKNVITYTCDGKTTEVFIDE